MTRRVRIGRIVLPRRAKGKPDATATVASPSRASRRSATFMSRMINLINWINLIEKAR